MTNAEIVDALEVTARLLELHDPQDANTFRTRAFQTAAFNLDKTTADLAQLPVAELTKLPGVGRSVANVIRELAETGHAKELDELLAQTPEGVLAMFKINGLGVKKVRALWHQHGIDSLDALRSAAETGEIAKIKGFGEKMQGNILQALEFLQSQTGKLRMDKAQAVADQLLDLLRPLAERVEVTGQVYWRATEVDTVQLLVQTDDPLAVKKSLKQVEQLEENETLSSPFRWRGSLAGYSVDVELLMNPRGTFAAQLFINRAPDAHLAYYGTFGQPLLQAALRSTTDDEHLVYQQAGLPYVVPEMRDNERAFGWAAEHSTDDLITFADLRGTVHNHSTWSDGKNSIRDMAEATRALGMQYFGIADHSPTASYANGLSAGRVVQQWAEIDALNAEYAANGATFRIVKGIESDILGDGSLDYTPDILAGFDYVVASVHQTLNMSKEKATARLLRAIENPYTTMLGHPTGRLLLAREGYPIDHRAIIDACADRNVVIEINASPYRLDLDWRWIDYALSRGVMLSINPDAHSTAGLLDMHWGVAVARKGGLTKAMTFNALPLAEISAWLERRKSSI